MRGHETEIEFAPLGETAMKLIGVLTIDEQDGEVHYVRQVAKVRFHLSSAKLIELGSSLHFLGKRWIVFGRKWRKSLDWTEVHAAHLETEASSGVAWSGDVRVFQHCITSGENARPIEEPVFNARAVIATIRPTSDNYTVATELTEKHVAYMDKYNADRLRVGWSIADGLNHYRVDSVGHLSRLDVLPYITMTRTGFAA